MSEVRVLPPLPRSFSVAASRLPLCGAERERRAGADVPNGSAGHLRRKEKSSGNRSTSRDHARLHGVQAAELPDEQVEAEHARPVRVEEVLPLVPESHAAPGDPLAGMARPPRTRRGKRTTTSSSRAATARARDRRRAGQAGPAGEEPDGRAAGAAGGFRGFTTSPAASSRRSSGRAGASSSRRPWS